MLRLNRDAVRWFAGYFDLPFPFPKYDLVLIPEFAYGGMEHAGATFLREESVLFPSEPNEIDQLRRAQLIFHEPRTSGSAMLVTMRWFDDLWLKEGFANFMAAKATEALLPRFDAWNAFHATKVAAYRTDVTRGTTPIWQALPNLSAAKSAYGNIVYSKAPAVLRQAEFYVGEKAFQLAVRRFVKRHAYGAADWSDLVAALERASRRDLKAWAHAWVKRRGMPRVRVSWDSDGQGNMRNVELLQEDVLGEGGVWPMKLQVLASLGPGSAPGVRHPPPRPAHAPARHGRHAGAGIRLRQLRGPRLRAIRARRQEPRRRARAPGNRARRFPAGPGLRRALGRRSRSRARSGRLYRSGAARRSRRARSGHARDTACPRASRVSALPVGRPARRDRRRARGLPLAANDGRRLARPAHHIHANVYGHRLVAPRPGTVEGSARRNHCCPGRAAVLARPLPHHHPAARFE